MYSSYLKLMQKKIQNLSELMASTIGMDVTVVDSTLRRIAGTGAFSSKIDDNSPHNSIFREVLTSHKCSINHNKANNPICLNCYKYDTCVEKENLSLPILVNSICVGVVSAACFSEQQSINMEQRESETLSLMQYMVNVIENEILGIEQRNKIINNHAEINEVINCIDKGIIIINPQNVVLHINSSALGYLHMVFSEETILGELLDSLVVGIDYNIPENVENASCWTVKQIKHRVIYKINKLLMNEQSLYRILTFETIEDIVNKARIYKKNHIIDFSSIKGTSRVIQEAIKIAKLTAVNDSTILLYGESGTGKELFARSIHNESYRAERPFMAINCACMPESLIEAELFGYKRGAFTGADPQGRVGKFEAANGGTVFLDEIAEFPLHLQGKLLRVLQERQLERIGCNEAVPLDIRIIAASNKNLKSMVEKNLFRKDLYYRLNVIPINLPNLKERGDDVIILAEHILKALRYRMNKQKIFFDYPVLDLFKRYEWPGNIREMENVIEYAVNFCNGDVLKYEHLPKYIVEESHDVIRESLDSQDSFKSTLDVFKRDMLLEYLDKYGYSTESKRKIAKDLGMSLSTLYRKLQGMGVCIGSSHNDSVGDI